MHIVAKCYCNLERLTNTEKKSQSFVLRTLLRYRESALKVCFKIWEAFFLVDFIYHKYGSEAQPPPKGEGTVDKEASIEERDAART